MMQKLNLGITMLVKLRIYNFNSATSHTINEDLSIIIKKNFKNYNFN